MERGLEVRLILALFLLLGFAFAQIERSQLTGIFLPGQPYIVEDERQTEFVKYLDQMLGALDPNSACGNGEVFTWLDIAPGVIKPIKGEVFNQVTRRGWKYTPGKIEKINLGEIIEIQLIALDAAYRSIFGIWFVGRKSLTLAWCER